MEVVCCLTGTLDIGQEKVGVVVIVDHLVVPRTFGVVETSDIGIEQLGEPDQNSVFKDGIVVLQCFDHRIAVRAAPVDFVTQGKPFVIIICMHHSFLRFCDFSRRMLREFPLIITDKKRDVNGFSNSFAEICAGFRLPCGGRKEKLDKHPENAV